MATPDRKRWGVCQPSPTSEYEAWKTSLFAPATACRCVGTHRVAAKPEATGGAQSATAKRTCGAIRKHVLMRSQRTADAAFAAASRKWSFSQSTMSKEAAVITAGPL